MCGILGLAFQKGHSMRNSLEIQLILRKLLKASNARGYDATGVAFINMQKAKVIKHHIPATAFVDTKFYKKMSADCTVMDGTAENRNDEPVVILGHTRQKTKGTQLNRHNNHPIIANRVVGVHNGVIINDDDIFDLHADHIERKAMVDSEIIFRLIDHYSGRANRPMIKAIKRSVRQLSGSMACALVNVKEPWVMYLFRASGPIDVYRYPERGLVMFASNRSFIDKAVENVDLGRKAVIPLEESEGLAINLQENKQTRFKVSKAQYKKQW